MKNEYNADDMAIIESEIEDFDKKCEEMVKLDKQGKLDKAKYKNEN